MKTIDQIKNDLPAVTVKANKRYFIGTVHGRLNDFATIYFNDGFADINFEASWELVQRAVNDKVDIIYC